MNEKSPDASETVCAACDGDTAVTAAPAIGACDTASTTRPRSVPVVPALASQGWRMRKRRASPAIRFPIVKKSAFKPAEYNLLATAMNVREKASSTAATSLAQRRDENVARGVASTHPIWVTRASGAALWDADGRRYLDFAGGIGTLNAGHANPKVVAAIAAQAAALTHACFQVTPYEPYLRVAEELNRRAPGPSPQEDAAAFDRRRGDRERDQDRARVHSPSGGHRLHALVSRPHAARALDDRQERAVQAALRPVLQRDLSRAVSVRASRNVGEPGAARARAKSSSRRWRPAASRR